MERGKIAAQVGIRSRRVAGADETASDLAVCAAERLFAEMSELRALVDFVLFCTQSPNYFLPNPACLIQKRLRLSTTCARSILISAVQATFAGFLFAKGLACVGVAKNVLLLTGETYSKDLAYALAVTLVLAAALKFCSGRVSRLVGIGR